MARRRSKISGQFSYHLIEMLESPAYRVLSLSARRVLDRIEIELAHHGGADNGRLPVTFDNFQSYGIDRQAIAPAIREVVALGFVEITERGRAGNAEWRKPNLFRLTYRQARGFHGDGSHEWRKFNTLQDATLVARAAREAKSAKQNSSRGKPHISGGEILPENPGSKVGNPTLQSEVGKPTLLSISRVGDDDHEPNPSPLA